MNIITGILRDLADLKKRIARLETMGSPYFTQYGGYAVKAIAGQALVEGEVVQITQGIAGATMTVFKNAIDSDMPVGVCYADAAQGASVYVVVSGVGYVLPNAADSPARGYVIYSSSTTAGRVSQANAVPAITIHVREVGHWLESTAQGVKARAIIHFN